MVCQACGTSNDTEPRKRCPRCAEWIHGLAKVCKHCGTEILSPSERLFVGYGIAFYLLIVGVVVIAVLFGYFVFMYNLFNLSKLLK